MLDAVNVITAQPIDGAGELDRSDAFGHFFQQDSYLQPGYMIAEAEMRPAPAEGHVQVWRAVDDEAMRIAELSFVTIT